MRPSFKIEHEFVEFIPKERLERVLYVSIPCATAVHNCFCGCGTKVVTPIGPARWHLLFNGETVSLNPSVGNWAYPCRSHYYIKNDTVLWAGDMSDASIALGRQRDRAALRAHFNPPVVIPTPVTPVTPTPTPALKKRKSLINRVRSWFG